MSPVLVVCAQSHTREAIAEAIVRCRKSSICCSTVSSARAQLAQQHFSAVCCQDDLADGTFQDVLRIIARERLDVRLIVLSRQDSWDAFLMALKAGAFDYIACPPDPGEAERILGAAIAAPSPASQATLPAA